MTDGADIVYGGASINETGIKTKIEDANPNASQIETETEIETETYPIPDVKYLGLPKSLIKGLHSELPNPYYKQQTKEIEEHRDYSHPTEHIIRTIVSQYGPFSEISEAKLSKIIDENKKETEKQNYGNTGEEFDVEMKDQDSEHENENGSSNDGTEKSDIKDQDDELQSEAEFYEKRNEMLKNVRQALGASTVALDLVSLVLSSVRPAAGSSSMSKHLSENVKIGSLSCSKTVPKPTTKDEILDSMKIGRGWKLQSLAESSTFVRESVDRLRNEAQKERRYWDDVLDVLKANELITNVTVPVRNNGKMMQQKKVMAVKYGFRDSGSDYFDKGIALLEKSKVDGRLVFVKMEQNEREKIWGGDKIVSVKIFHKGLLVGQSDSYGTLKNAIEEDDGFVNKIKNSRFFIFENELFWHLVKEAAGLINLHVTVDDNIIKIGLRAFYIQIENLDAKSKDLSETTPVLPLNDRADKIIKFFRILLCTNNSKNMRKQNIPPVAMGRDGNFSKSRQGFLIRPLIMYTEHNLMIKEMENVIKQISPAIQVSTKRYINDPNNYTDNDVCVNDDPFIRIYSKVSPISTIEFQSGDLNVRMDLVSNYNTLHITMEVKIFKTSTKEQVLKSTFNYKKDLQDCLSWVLKQYK